MSPQRHIGRAIRRFRKLRGWTQPDLAQRVGCNVQTVCQWERGNRRMAFLDVCKLALVLGVPVCQFVPVLPVPSLPEQP